MMKRIAIAAAATMLLAQAHATTVRIHYAAGKDTIQVRADKGAAGWSQGVPAKPEGGPLNVWTFTWPDALGDIQMKPTLGADKVSIGGVYKLAAGSTVDIYPFFGPPFGKVTIVKDDAEVKIIEPKKSEVELAWTDPNPTAGKTSYYYARGEQANGELVWVSPMWVNYEPGK